MGKLLLFCGQEVIILWMGILLLGWGIGSNAGAIGLSGSISATNRLDSAQVMDIWKHKRWRPTRLPQKQKVPCGGNCTGYLKLQEQVEGKAIRPGPTIGDTPTRVYYIEGPRRSLGSGPLYSIPLLGCHLLLGLGYRIGPSSGQMESRLYRGPDPRRSLGPSI